MKYKVGQVWIPRKIKGEYTDVITIIEIDDYTVYYDRIYNGKSVKGIFGMHISLEKCGWVLKRSKSCTL